MNNAATPQAPAAPAKAGGTRARRRSWGASALMGFALVAGSLTMGALVIAPAAPASAAPINQCNSVDNTPGLGIECDITVANHLDMATGVGSSTVTIRECHGAANTAPATCTGPTTTDYTELTTAVSQCNSVLDGGGASLHCTIHVVNTITGATTATAATINQCADSLGGGTVVLRACSPDGVTTTNATITECNGTANGGTSSLTCVVEPGSTETAQLRVLVNQCNSSANGGGSLVVCSVGMSTVIVPASTEGTGGTGETGGGTGGTGDTSGGTGGTAAGAGGPVLNSRGAGSAITPPASESERLATTGVSAAIVVPAAGALLGGIVLLLMRRITRARLSR
jgi:hypothetical protein